MGKLAKLTCSRPKLLEGGLCHLCLQDPEFAALHLADHHQYLDWLCVGNGPEQCFPMLLQLWCCTSCLRHSSLPMVSRACHHEHWLQLFWHCCQLAGTAQGLQQACASGLPQRPTNLFQARSRARKAAPVSDSLPGCHSQLHFKGVPPLV